MYLYSIYVFFKAGSNNHNKYDFYKYPISIIVPAYNEQVSIITCIEMLSNLDYPDYEIILVNDGSTDNTLQHIHNNFTLINRTNTQKQLLKTMKIKSVFDIKDKNIVVIDKENGGKADAINTGINFAKGDYICTIDADSILDNQALKSVVIPFIKSQNTIVTGGQLAVANDIKLENNKVVNAKTPKNIWVQWQIIEYIKSFMIARIALSKINALLIMSGAFSLFKKDDLLQIGGFLSPVNNHSFIEKNIGTGKQTVCEDMEIVVRLWKYKRDKKINAKALFLAQPVCWTEVPDNPQNLFKQRSRWHQGLGETINIHKNMIFEPRYGVTGLIGLPYYLFFEFLSPLIKIFSLIFIFVAAKYGVINTMWVIMLLASVMLTSAIIMSTITAVIEYWSNKNYPANRDALRYKTFGDWLWLIITGIVAEFSYSFFKIAAQLNGIINFIKKKHDWKKFERKGVEREV